jgi:hypothetical protein
MKKLCIALLMLLSLTAGAAVFSSSVHSLSGAANLITYVGGTAKKPAPSNFARLAVNCKLTTAGAGSTYTSQSVKLQRTRDNTNWDDIPSQRNDSSMTVAIEHSVTAPAAGSSTTNLFQTDAHTPAAAWRVATKFVGAGGAVGDITLCSAWWE